MKFEMQMTSEEIAVKCGLNSAQTRKRISRAVERLRRHPAVQSLLRENA
jgi:DNA-directed RNA polymerase specialized sigma24 family protein